jgi:hypothetical protein
VISGWRDRQTSVQALGIDSAVALDPRRLAVTVRDQSHSAPALFAEPVLAATPPLDATAPATGWIAGPRRPRQPQLEFEVSPDDARDALDRGADLVVTRDPALVQYAASRPEFKTIPLPWTRTYVLLQPVGNEPIEGIALSDSARRSLARDAVKGEARPAEPPFWWDTLDLCGTAGKSEISPQPSARVAYPRADPVARGLAERIVALGRSGSPLRAAGLADSEFAAAVRQGDERAYVVPLPRQSRAPCRDPASFPVRASALPLIDTRARAIVRRGSPELTVDWDGTVRVLGEDPSGEDSP